MHWIEQINFNIIFMKYFDRNLEENSMYDSYSMSHPEWLEISIRTLKSMWKVLLFNFVENTQKFQKFDFLFAENFENFSIDSVIFVRYNGKVYLKY